MGIHVFRPLYRNLRGLHAADTELDSGTALVADPDPFHKPGNMSENRKEDGIFMHQVD